MGQRAQHQGRPDHLGEDRTLRDGTSSLEAMTTADLIRLRADLNISLALAAPGSAVAVPAERQLASIAFVLSARAHEDSRSDGTGMPLPGGGPYGVIPGSPGRIPHAEPAPACPAVNI